MQAAARDGGEINFHPPKKKAAPNVARRLISKVVVLFDDSISGYWAIAVLPVFWVRRTLRHHYRHVVDHEASFERGTFERLNYKPELVSKV